MSQCIGRLWDTIKTLHGLALDAGVDGSSEGSRVTLGTLGHHHEWADQRTDDSTGGEITSFEHPDTISPDGEFAVTLEADNSAGTKLVVEVDTAGDAEVTLSTDADDAVAVEDTLIEFSDPSAGISTYTVDTDLTGGEDGEEVPLSGWVNADNPEDADDIASGTVFIQPTHRSGVDQEVWEKVTDQNAPTDELTFNDLIDGIQAHNNNESINGVELGF